MYTFGLNNEKDIERKYTGRRQTGDYRPKVYNRD